MLKLPALILIPDVPDVSNDYEWIVFCKVCGGLKIVECLFRDSFDIFFLLTDYRAV